MNTPRRTPTGSGAKTLARDEGGSVMAEFALVLTFFSLVAWGAFTTVGATANTQLTQTQTNFGDVTTNNPPSGYSNNSYE
jgi:Flp pilus assembly pilin Flp